jgi:O-antigen ligase
MQALNAENKWKSYLSMAILFLSVALFAYSGYYLFLAVPFVYLYILLLGANWKLAYWIFLFCIPASIQLWFLGDSLSTTVPDEPMMWCFLLMFTLMFVNNPGILPQWWWRNPLVGIIVAQYIWLIVTVCFSEEPLFSIKFLLAKTWFLVSFFVLPVFIFKEKKDYRTGFILTLIPLLATMIIIFIKHYLIGFNFRKVEKAIGDLYYNHVDYSTVMSMFFPLVPIALSLMRGWSWLLRIPLFLIGLFFIPAIYFTYARAAMLAVVFAYVVYFAIRFRLANWLMPAFYGLMALLMAYMIRDNKFMDFRPNYHQTYMHKTWADHVIATFRGEDMSSMERLYRWIAGVRMSNDRPITGYGPNSFYYYYKPYAVTAFRTYVSRNEEMSTTHNYFLYMLVEQGWPAMILYAVLLMVFFSQAQKIYYRFNDRFYKKVTLAVAMTFGAGFVNNFFSELLETHKVGALFYMSIALLVLLDKKSKDLAAVNSAEAVK